MLRRRIKREGGKKLWRGEERFLNKGLSKASLRRDHWSCISKEVRGSGGQHSQSRNGKGPEVRVCLACLRTPK